MKQVPQETLERHDDAVAGAHLRHLRPHLFDDTHRLVPEHVPCIKKRPEHLVEMVRSADPGRRHAHDHVGRLDDRRIGDVLDPNVALVVPGDRLHRTGFPPVTG
jgi:hypothetical protein